MSELENAISFLNCIITKVNFIVITKVRIAIHRSLPRELGYFEDVRRRPTLKKNINELINLLTVEKKMGDGTPCTYASAVSEVLSKNIFSFGPMQSKSTKMYGVTSS